MSLVTPTPNRNTLRCVVCGARFIALRADALTCSPRCRVARHRRLQASTPPWPHGTFDLVMIDLPLAWKGWSHKGEGRSPQAHYQTLDIPALVGLLKPMLAATMAKHSIAAWWVYGPRLPDTLHVLEATGWIYTSELLVWQKPGMGNGKTTRKNCESLWGSKRGAGIPVRDHAVRQTIEAPRRRHSEKPDVAYQALERLYGDVRRLDLFGRKPRPGWVVWGNEVGVVEAVE
jgi:N6-adenosine-specific RNA methylase IME4